MVLMFSKEIKECLIDTRVLSSFLPDTTHALYSGTILATTFATFNSRPFQIRITSAPALLTISFTALQRPISSLFMSN